MIYSGWMANLGVEPLVLSLAFLLLPCLVFALFLLFFVTRDFETIAMLLKGQYCHRRGGNLTLVSTDVKAFFCIAFLMAGPLLAKTVKDTSSHIVLGRGELKSLFYRHLKHFSIGNRDILSAKFHPKKGELILKAKKIGHTTLIIWQAKKAKGRTIDVFVLSKKKQLVLAQMAKALEQRQLSAEIVANSLVIRAPIETHAQYQLLFKLKKKYPRQIAIESKMSQKLKRKILGQVYFWALKNGVDFIDCQAQKMRFLCHYDSLQKMDPTAFKALKKQFDVHFLPLAHHQLSKNFKIQLKVVQLEGHKGREFSFGLDQIEGSYRHVFERGVTSLIENNQIKLKKEKINASLIASPEIIASLGKSAQFEIGANIPYQTSNSPMHTPILEWKFAGLKASIQLVKKHGRFILKYSTQFTHPKGQDIAGSKEKSQLFITLNRPIKIFQIGHKAQADHLSSLPVLGSIPLLGKLFQAKGVKVSFKKIYGLVKITRVPPHKD